MNRQRIAWLAVLFGIGTLPLFSRIWVLQVSDHDFWTKEALKARTRKESRPSRRGAILDRLGRPLAEGVLTYDLVMIYGEFRKSTSVGAIQMLHFLATGERPPLRDLFDSPEGAADFILDLPVTEVLECRPGIRRLDFLFYLNRFTELKRTRETREKFEAMPPGSTIAQTFPTIRSEMLEGISRDQARLSTLEGALDEIELVESIDEALAKIDRDVARASRNRDEKKSAFEWERQLHSDYDHRIDRWRRENIPHDLVVTIELRPEDFPGFHVIEVDRRRYPSQTEDILPGLIGFVREPTRPSMERARGHLEEYATLRQKEDKTQDDYDRLWELEIFVDELDYALGEEQGYRGLEGALEGLLRGKRGWRKVEKDARSYRVFEELEVREPVPGSDIRLTLDIDLQQAVEDVLDRTGELIGAPFTSVGLAMMSLPHGEILALGSWPRVPRKEYLSEMFQKNRDVYHKAYDPYSPPPPGSVFKPVIAIAGIEEGVIDSAFTVFCNRGVGEGKARFKCLGHHGDADLEKAMSKSCNAYFAEVAVALGYERVAQEARKFGYGEKSDFAVAGLLPRFKNDLERPWGGDLVLPREVKGEIAAERPGIRRMRAFGCGQGFIDDCTAIQVARSFGAIATGYLPTPHIVKEILGGVGDGFMNEPIPTPLAVSPFTLKSVRESLHSVMRAGGTAARENDRDLYQYGLVGKTGTPEYSVPTGDPQDPWKNHSHALFGGYLPHDNPRIALALIVYETPLHGGDVARPILDELFQDPRVIPYLRGDAWEVSDEDR